MDKRYTRFSPRPDNARTVMTYTEIAEGTGLSLSHISRIMTQQVFPSVPGLIAISRVLGMSLDELSLRLHFAERTDALRGRKEE